MGRGNWTPCDRDTYCEYRYININQLVGIDEEESSGQSCDWQFEMLMDMLEYLLPDSFTKTKKHKSPASISRCTSALFSNSLVTMVIEDSADSYDCVGVGFVINEDQYSETHCRNFGPKYLDNLAEKFFESLNCDQSTRTSAWTSSMIKKFKSE